MLLERICKCLKKHNISYAVVGGFAVALHGVPRGTVDIDFIVSFEEAAFVGVEKALRSIGFQPRLPVTGREVFQFRKEYIEQRNLIAWSFYNPTNPIEIVDIIITDNLDDNSAVEKTIADWKVRVISKKDLIRMKKRSGRPQDLADVAGLEKV